MTERPDAAAPAVPDGDYGYDLAHEVPPPPAHGEPEHRPTQVSTATDDTEGDYGYDLAHELPTGEGQPPR